MDIPPNDACENATAINFQSTGYPVNTVAALTDFNDETCNVRPNVRGVWYKYRPSENMNITLKTSGKFYHQIAVFNGESCDTFLITCKTAETSLNLGESFQATFQAESGVQYFFLVTGYNQFTDVGTLTLKMTSDREVSSMKPKSTPSPQAPTPTEKPLLRPVPAIVPERTSSPQIIQTRLPNSSVPTKIPTISPVAVTKQPVKLPKSRPVKSPTKVTSKPEKAPVVLPKKSPTNRPTGVPSSPTEPPTTSPVDFTIQPALSPTKVPISRPTKVPVAPPRKLPTNTPETDLPTAVPIVNISSSCPDGSAGPKFPNECKVDCPLSGPPVPGCVKFCDVRRIFGCAPVCSGSITAILPGGCRERCCRDIITPTDQPTSTPAVKIIDTPNPPNPTPFRPMLTSDLDDDDSNSHKGKGRMHHYYSGKGKGRMHSKKGMGKMYHRYYSGKGKGKSDDGIMSRYNSHWDISGWLERRRRHGKA